MASPGTNRGLDEIKRIAASAPSAMVKMGEAIVLVIKERTRAGIDRHGGQFLPYGDRHARRRRQFGLSQAPVNLTFSGRMLGDLHVLDGTGAGFDLSGRGSKFRRGAGSPQGGEFVAASDVEMQIGFLNLQNEYIAGVHASGDYGRGPNKPRDIMGLTDLESQEMARVFGKNLYRTKSTEHISRITINLG